MNTGTISNKLSSVKTTPVILNGSYFATYQPSNDNPITNNNQGNPKNRYGEERGVQGGRAVRGCPPAFFLTAFLFTDEIKRGIGFSLPSVYLLSSLFCNSAFNSSEMIRKLSPKRSFAQIIPVAIHCKTYFSFIALSSSWCNFKNHSDK